ncbi:MAG: ATP-binding protein [Phycisphaerales bacterium]
MTQATPEPKPLTDREPHVRLEMMSQPRYLSGARDMVSAIARRLGFNDGECGQIALAVDEALCNVIRHGYDRAADKPIWLNIWPYDVKGEARGIQIVIEDEARQVDTEAIRGRDLEDVKPGGLGVYIIKQVMDFAEFEKREGKGMKLTLVKLVTDQAEDTTENHKE